MRKTEKERGFVFDLPLAEAASNFGDFMMVLDLIF
jgi:hypothetical protein